MKKRRFSLYKFTPQSKFNKKLKPHYTGIYHKKEKCIATDGLVLCVINQSYPPDYEGKIINRKGEHVRGKFPPWKRVIPKYGAATVIELDPDLPARIEAGLSEAKKTKQRVVAKIKAPTFDFYTHGERILLLFDFLAKFPDSKVYCKEPTRALKACDDKGNLCLVMPVACKTNEDWTIMV